MSLIVCAQELVAAQCRRGPSHVVSLLAPGLEPPPAPADAQHLRLFMNDIVETTPGLVAPSREHVAELLAFARRWSGERPLLVHCQAGVSRSPAAALAIACQHRPDLDELRLARALRAAAPQAAPNALILRLADDLLGRGGRLVAAGRAIGLGAPWTGPCAFELLPAED